MNPTEHLIFFAFFVLFLVGQVQMRCDRAGRRLHCWLYDILFAALLRRSISPRPCNISDAPMISLSSVRPLVLGWLSVLQLCSAAVAYRRDDFTCVSDSMITSVVGDAVVFALDRVWLKSGL